MTTTLSPNEIARRAAEVIAERQASYAMPPPPKRLSRSHRRAVARGVTEFHRRQALANDDVSPAKRARLQRNLSLQQAAKLAGVALNSVHRAENPEKPTSLRVWRSLSRVYGLPVKVLRDG